MALNDTLIKFEPPEGRDTMMKKGHSKDIKVHYQCITVMKEYDNKSQEELRLDYYIKSKRCIGMNTWNNVRCKTQIDVPTQASTSGATAPLLQTKQINSTCTTSALKKVELVPKDNISSDTQSRTSISSQQQNTEKSKTVKELNPKTHKQKEKETCEKTHQQDDEKEICQKTHKQEKNDLCIICCEEKKTHILVPCGHVTCQPCGKRITNQSESPCPFCRKIINNMIKIHW